MKHALISDIHGNYPALKAVLDDAKKRGVQKYLFLGDYVEDLPWPNEVVDTIKSIENAVVIGGNKEDYLLNLEKQGKENWIYEQMAPMYWNCSELTTENLKYLISLPKTAEIHDSGAVIRLSHTSRYFLSGSVLKVFESANYSKKMRVSPFTHKEYLEYTRKCIYADTFLMDELKKITKSSVAFGHSHLQWHMVLGDNLYINPGSCGMPLDFDTSAPYTIIEPCDDGWNVTEIRIPYDIGYTINMLKASTLYKKAKVWSELIIEELIYAEERINFFVQHMNEIAKNLGYLSRPVSNEAWQMAVETWPEKKKQIFKK